MRLFILTALAASSVSAALTNEQVSAMEPHELKAHYGTKIGEYSNVSTSSGWLVTLTPDDATRADTGLPAQVTFQCEHWKLFAALDWEEKGRGRYCTKNGKTCYSKIDIYYNEQTSPPTFAALGYVQTNTRNNNLVVRAKKTKMKMKLDCSGTAVAAQYKNFCGWQDTTDNDSDRVLSYKPSYGDGSNNGSAQNVLNSLGVKFNGAEIVKIYERDLVSTRRLDEQGPGDAPFNIAGKNYRPKAAQHAEYGDLDRVLSLTLTIDGCSYTNSQMDEGFSVDCEHAPEPPTARRLAEARGDGKLKLKVLNDFTVGTIPRGDITLDWF